MHASEMFQSPQWSRIEVTTLKCVTKTEHTYNRHKEQEVRVGGAKKQFAEHEERAVDVCLESFEAPYGKGTFLFLL